MATELKYPPAGVATSPTAGDDYVPLKVAAKRLHMDSRTVQGAVVAGDLRGWARPGPQRLRWFVYEDQLPGPFEGPPASIVELRAEVAELRTTVIPALRGEIEELRRRTAADLQATTRTLVQEAIAELRAEVGRLAESTVADLRAQNVTLTETNLLLLEAQDELGTASTSLQSAGQKYREALALFMTPGHPGQLEAR